MKIRPILIIVWSFLIVCFFVYINAARQPTKFIESDHFNLTLDGLTQWVWTVPRFIDISNSQLTKNFDQLMLHVILLFVWGIGMFFLKPPKELLGLKMTKGDFDLFSTVALLLGLLGLLMILYAGPWQWATKKNWVSIENLIVIYCYQTIAGPLFEELLFRGALQGALSKIIEPLGAAIFVAIFFTSMHSISISQVNSFPIFVGAIALGFLRLKTNSLPTCFMLHLLGNAFLVSVNLFLVRA